MTEKMTLEHLFNPISLGRMTLRNRIAMAGMATGFFSKEGLVTERAVNYYEARAKGGAGMIIVEASCVDVPRGHSLYRPAIDSDITIPGLMHLARTIKSHGARAIIQLYHAGRIGRMAVTGFQAVAPSPIPYPIAGLIQTALPKELTVDEIKEIVRLFAAAAVRAKRAGFDGIEIHAAHAYLLAQFLAPNSNQRVDQYGGSAENRARLVVEILTAIRQAVGDQFPLWCRISGQETGIQNPLTIEDAKVTAMMINNLVHAIHVSEWGYGRSPASLTYLPSLPGAILPLSAEIKRTIAVPVIAVGRLDAELGNQAIVEGKADIIAMGRELIADPDLPNKSMAGNLQDIKPCLACFHCSDITETPNTIMISCAVNAAVGKEGEHKIQPTETTKKVAVVGAGPAGLEAAYLLALRGHDVTLLERNAQLGGQMSLAIAPPNKKERLEPYLNYMKTRLRKLKVDVRLNTEATPSLMEDLKPDFVVLATGGKPVLPGIPGVNEPNVVTAFDVLSGKKDTGKKTVIVGGGSTGCETAEFLASDNKEITILEMLPDLANDLGPRDKLRLLCRLNTLPITIRTNAKCVEIVRDGVIVQSKENQREIMKADSVVICTGVTQENSLFGPLKSKGFDIRVIGDAWHIGKIVGAVHEGFGLGCAF